MDVEQLEVAEASEPTKKSRKKINHLLSLQPGVHAIISGGTGTGKTRWVVDGILGRGVHCYPMPVDAIVCLVDSISIAQPLYDELEEKFTGAGGVKFVEGIPYEQEQEFVDAIKENKNNKMKTLIIIDDLMIAAKSAKAERFVDKLFTSIRHLNATVYEITQTHTGSRTRRLNSGLLVTFQTRADVGSLAHIARSIRPETKGHDVLACYRQATSKPHGCLIIDLVQPNQFMFRDTSLNTAFDLDAVQFDETGRPQLD